MEDLGKVVNTLKWVDMTGADVAYAYSALLPRPNLWERLRASGIEPVTIQPGSFEGTPLSRALYRGARFEGVWDTEDMIGATAQLAGTPHRLIFVYVPQADYAGHVFGLEGAEFAEAMRLVADVWEGIAGAMPPDVTLLGTADHGLAEFGEDRKILIRGNRYTGLRFAGDPRGVNLWGDPGLMEMLAEETGGSLADPGALIGPDPTPTALSRVGQRVLLPPDDIAVIPKGFDRRLRCYHGGLSRAEVEIPLLVG
jgi:hypothetical protein